MKPAIREADGVKIRFAEAGQGGSETVVFTCPWPESLFALLAAVRRSTCSCCV